MSDEIGPRVTTAGKKTPKREKNPLALRIGYRLKRFRELRGLDPKALGSQIEIDSTTYGQYERGWALIPVDNLLKVCSELGCSPNDVLGYPESGGFNDEERLLISLRRRYRTPAMRSGLLDDARRRLESENQILGEAKA